VFAFDIPTLFLVSTIAVVVTMISFVIIWRLIPEEESLSDWALGGGMLAAGAVLVAVRKLVPEAASVVGGNTLLVLGIGYLHVGVRGLLGRPPTAPWHWLAAFAAFAGCVWFFYFSPSVAARIVLVSLLFVTFMVACAWLFQRHADPDLRATHTVTAGIFAVGALLFLFRAFVAPSAVVTPDFTSTTSVLIVLPNLYLVIFSVWLGVTVPLCISARLQRRLLDARDQAEAANRAKSVFLSSMSHELRTPMNAILGFAQILESEDDLASAHREHVKEILKGGRHLLDLVNEVLDLARIESGRIALSMESVELAALVEECRDLIRPLAERRRISLATDVATDAVVHADPVRLKQVLFNLLSNAVKYNREGGDIRLTAMPGQAGRLRIAVADTGVGIAPERMAELFKPFSRLGAEYSGIEGTGIGLTITQRLVQLMGGEIGVDSSPGVGSTVWVDLSTRCSPEGRGFAGESATGGTTKPQ
jgi:signal transduction histidine kinase